MIDHDHIADLLPAYALGCLDDDEAVLVSEHFAACEKCYARLMQLRQTADLLAYGIPVVFPPDTVKTKLMRKIGPPSDIFADSQPTHSPPQWRRTSLRPRFSSAWAAAGIIMIIVLAVINLIQWQTRTAGHQSEVKGGLLIIKMKGTLRAPEGDGTFVISQDRKQGVLVASDLPVLDQRHQYQLWMEKDGQRISGGLFSVSPNGYAVVKIQAEELLTNFRSFEVTVEPRGGSPKPGDNLVMVSRL